MSIVKELLRKLAKKSFPKRRVIKILKLRSEASTRNYYRLRLSAGFSVVAMLINELDKDPEIVSRVREATDVFKSYGVRVPCIFDWHPEEKVMFVRDAGSSTLEDVCQGHGVKFYLPFYKQIIDHLLILHWAPVPEGIENKIPMKISFTQSKFEEEFRFFIRHSGLAEKMDPATLNKITDLFQSVSQKMTQEKYVLTHRDLHSRNIHIKDHAPFYIDHQDARMGPYQYDLVSLIRDSYVHLSHKAETELVKYYLDQALTVWKADMDQADFFKGYYLCLFQRSVKACGTFYFQTYSRKHVKYQKYIPLVLQYALTALHKLVEEPSQITAMQQGLEMLIREQNV